MWWSVAATIPILIVFISINSCHFRYLKKLILKIHINSFTPFLYMVKKRDAVEGKRELANSHRKPNTAKFITS